MSEARPKQLKIRISENERYQLELLAIQHGIKVSDYVRMMIDREITALRELMTKGLVPLEFSYQAELVRRGLAKEPGKTKNGKKR